MSAVATREDQKLQTALLGLLSSAGHAAELVPDDALDLETIPKALYLGTGGDLVVIGEDAPADAAGVTFRNLPDGALLALRARRVLATGTTAGDILGLY